MRAQAARVPLRAVQRVHRGPPPRTPRRHHERPGHRHLPRRLDARGEGRRPARRQPVRRRPGDHGPAALVRRCGCSASAPTSRRSVRERPRACIPNFIEETLRLESPLRAPVPHGQGAARSSAASTIPAGGTLMLAARRRQPRPRAVREPRTSSTSTAPTPASTSPSGTASTPAPAPPWPGPRAGSRSTASSTGRPTSRSPRRRTARAAPAATTTCRRSSSAASPTSTSSSRPAVMTFNPFDPEQAHDAWPLLADLRQAGRRGRPGRRHGLRHPPRRVPPADARHLGLLQRPGLQGPRRGRAPRGPDAGRARPAQPLGRAPGDGHRAHPQGGEGGRALRRGDGSSAAGGAPRRRRSRPRPRPSRRRSRTRRPSTCSASPRRTGRRSWPGPRT